MLSFADQLGNLVKTINDGPGALNPALFSGHIDRVILGLKAHANTISHARLVALEDTFPRTRNALGESVFNSLCRDYCETPPARASDPNRIGEGFIAFLQTRITDGATCNLCRIEWAWLESYHAPDTPPLTLAKLAAIDPSALLTLNVTHHPAARMIALDAPISPELDEFAGETGAPAMLLSRPGHEVKLMTLTDLDMAIFCAAKIADSIGNLLSLALERESEQENEQAALGTILKLVGAGALSQAG